MEINTKLKNDILSYCKLNGFDEDEYLNKILKNAFMLDKYGDRPPVFGSKPQRLSDQEIPEEKKRVIVNYSFVIEKKKTEKKTTRRKKEVVEDKKNIQIDTPIDTAKNIEDKPKKRTRKLTAK